MCTFKAMIKKDGTRLIDEEEALGYVQYTCTVYVRKYVIHAAGG